MVGLKSDSEVVSCVKQHSDSEPEWTISVVFYIYVHNLRTKFLKKSIYLIDYEKDEHCSWQKYDQTKYEENAKNTREKSFIFFLKKSVASRSHRSSHFFFLTTTGALIKLCLDVKHCHASWPHRDLDVRATSRVFKKHS